MWSPGWQAVLFVGDVLTPRGTVIFVVDLQQREVGHEAVGGGTVPVLLARLEDDARPLSHGGSDMMPRAIACINDSDIARLQLPPMELLTVLAILDGDQPELPLELEIRAAGGCLRERPVPPGDAIAP